MIVNVQPVLLTAVSGDSARYVNNILCKCQCKIIILPRIPPYSLLADSESGLSIASRKPGTGTTQSGLALTVLQKQVKRRRSIEISNTSMKYLSIF